MADPNNNQGELLVANACKKSSTPSALSSFSTSSIEEVGKINPDGVKFFQIYMDKSDEINSDIWNRCKDNGFHGFVVTTDSQGLGKRVKDVHNKWKLPSHMGIANYKKYGLESSMGTMKKG